MDIPLQGPESEGFPGDWEYHSCATRQGVFASPDLIYGGLVDKYQWTHGPDFGTFH